MLMNTFEDLPPALPTTVKFSSYLEEVAIGLLAKVRCIYICYSADIQGNDETLLKYCGLK